MNAVSRCSYTLVNEGDLTIRVPPTSQPGLKKTEAEIARSVSASCYEGLFTRRIVLWYPSLCPIFTSILP